MYLEKYYLVFKKVLKTFNLKMYIMYLKISKVYPKIFNVCVKNVHWVLRKIRRV